MVAFDWNDLPVGREFDCKFLKDVKSPPHALPSPTGCTLIGALYTMAAFLQNELSRMLLRALKLATYCHMISVRRLRMVYSV